MLSACSMLNTWQPTNDLMFIFLETKPINLLKRPCVEMSLTLSVGSGNSIWPLELADANYGNAQSRFDKSLESLKHSSVIWSTSLLPMGVVEIACYLSIDCEQSAAYVTSVTWPQEWTQTTQKRKKIKLDCTWNDAPPAFIIGSFDSI